MKELQRTKKDRETLLEITERAQSTIKDLDKAKFEIEKLTLKNIELETSIEVLKKTKEENEKELKKLNQEKIKLGLKLAGSEEKVSFLKEELKKQLPNAAVNTVMLK